MLPNIQSIISILNDKVVLSLGRSPDPYHPISNLMIVLFTIILDLK